MSSVMHVHADGNVGICGRLSSCGRSIELVSVELAATRGEKGFSGVVAEALDLYLESLNGQNDAIQAALALKGSMRGSDASKLLDRTRSIRENWR